MHFTSLVTLLAATGTLVSAYDPRAALARPNIQNDALKTRCTTFLSTVTRTRTRGDVDTSTSTILYLQPTVITTYATLTSTTTFLVTEDKTRTRTTTETVSECIGS